MASNEESIWYRIHVCEYNNHTNILKKTGCVTVPGNLSVDTTAQYPKEILNICCVRWWSLVSVRISPLRAPAYDGGIPLFFVFLTSLPLYY